MVDDILYCTVKTLPLNVNFFGTKINLYEDLPCDVVLLFHVCLILWSHSLQYAVVASIFPKVTGRTADLIKNSEEIQLN